MKAKRLRMFFQAAAIGTCITSLVGCGETDHAQSENVKLAAHGSNGPIKVRAVRLVSRALQRDVRLPGELVPYREVSIYPKVQGFVKSINVDRGKQVKRGDVLVLIVAPEIDAQCGEAEGRVEAARSAVSEAESKVASLQAEKDSAKAKLASDEALLKRIKHAAQTEGAVAPYDIEQAEQKVASHEANVRSSSRLIEAARSQLNSERGRLKAALQALRSAQQMKDYLTVRAPFDGVITERNVHEGSLVNSSITTTPMLKLQEAARLRLLLPVPENTIAGLHVGTEVSFTVPAFTARKFTGKVERISHLLDRKTRSMTVEADVDNRNSDLEPGMYPDVTWKMSVPYKTIFTPSSAVATSEDGKTYVVKIVDGTARPVDIVCKQSMNELVEIEGDVAEGDEVAFSSLHELKKGTAVVASLSSLEEAIQTAEKESGHN